LFFSGNLTNSLGIHFVLYQTARYKMIKFVKNYQVFYRREETLVVVKLQNCTQTMMIKSK